LWLYECSGRWCVLAIVLTDSLRLKGCTVGEREGKVEVP
jgi:hypothetical protein